MMTSTITLTRRIYTCDALEQTVKAFASVANVSISSDKEYHILRISATGRQVMDEFLNYALALSAQELLR